LIITKAFSLFWFTFDFGQGSVYNLNRGLTEKFGRLLVAFADDYREVEEVTAGNIVVLSGLKASHPRIR
jgi:translation elongation factor EF-G